jgi:chromosome segregation ATPase
MTLWDSLTQLWGSLPIDMQGALIALGVGLILWVGQVIRANGERQRLNVERASDREKALLREREAQDDGRKFVLETARASEVRIDAIMTELKDITAKYQDLRVLVAHKDGQIDVLTKQLAESMRKTVTQENVLAGVQRQMKGLDSALQLKTKELQSAQTAMNELKAENTKLRTEIETIKSEGDAEIARLEHRVAELETTQALAKSAAMKTEPNL